jgi:type VI secretion system protein ImpA
MASPAVLDFAKLLAPISPEKPTGVDPRGDISPTSPYFKIKGDRSDARAAERQALGGDPKAPVPDWKPVRQLGTKVLGEQAKDLEITAYVIEALLRLEGFAGLRDGFRLARELVEKHWDGLFPLPDEEGLVTRIAPLTGLNGEDAEGTLIFPMSRVPITDMTSLGRFTLSQYNEANALKKIADPKVVEKKIAEGALTLEAFNNAVGETPPLFYRNLVDDLTGCVEEFGKLSQTMDKACAGKGPPTSSIMNALTASLDTIKELAKDKLAVAPDKAAEAQADGAPAAAGAKAPAGPAGVIQNREQALENLTKVADFFRRTEPHSPLSYALDQVVRWGRMSLPDLWTELLGDGDHRKNVFKQVGIRLDDGKAAATKK